MGLHLNEILTRIFLFKKKPTRNSGTFLQIFSSFLGVLWMWHRFRHAVMEKVPFLVSELWHSVPGYLAPKLEVHVSGVGLHGASRRFNIQRSTFNLKLKLKLSLNLNINFRWKYPLQRPTRIYTRYQFEIWCDCTRSDWRRVRPVLPLVLPLGHF